MNKKAVFFSIFIVFVAAALSGYALYEFIILNDKADRSFNSAIDLDNLYIKTDNFVFYSKAAAELSAGQVFREITEKDFGTVAGFDKAVELKEFYEQMKKYFDPMTQKYPLQGDASDMNNVYNVEVRGDKLHFSISIILIDDSESVKKRESTLSFPYRVDYSRFIEFDLDLKDIGLESFEKIHDAMKKCGTETDSAKKKECYETDLGNFGVSVSANDIKEITLKTKKEFIYLKANKEEKDFIEFRFLEV